MFKYGSFTVLAILSALAINPAFAADKSIAMVNGISIPQSRVDMRVKAAVAQGQEDSPELRKALREDMINIEVMAQAAKKMGLEKNSEVIQQMELARQSILVNAFVQEYLKKHPISDEQFKLEYETLKTNLGNEEYNVRHILVPTEAEAKDIIAQLDKNGSFDKLSADKSKDAGSAANGGQLDWQVPSNFAQPFATAMLKLKKGEYTKEAVETQFGWHVIKLDDIRTLNLPSLEELKPQMQQRLQQQAVISEIASLRAKAKIE